MQTRFANRILQRQNRLAMPIGVYAGLDLTGASVHEAVTDASTQADMALAMHEQYRTEVLLTAMDLSAEAEAYGCLIRWSEDDIPTVTGRRVTSREEIARLPSPQAGEARTRVHLDAAGHLARTGIPVLGGLIGPFSLAARLFGVSETLEATATDPDLVLALLEETTRFLADYSRAFRQTGASGVIMAEPAAGLLSPRALARFSAPFVKRIVEASQTPDFVLILHNCGARLAHLPKVVESGAEIYHFGAPMDLVAALSQTGKDIILCGNLDPSAIFYSGSPEQVWERTGELLNRTCTYPNYVISSGCDLPPGMPLANLEAFFDAVRSAGQIYSG